jgi:hypothetical protein
MPTADEAAGRRATFMPPQEGQRRGTLRATSVRDEQGLPPLPVREVGDRPAYKSVMNQDAELPAGPSLPARRGGPVEEATYNAVRRKMDAMTPEQFDQIKNHLMTQG